MIRRSPKSTRRYPLFPKTTLFRSDPYLLEAEFYMDPADSDVSVTVPRGWVVGATGTLRNPDKVLTRSARASLAAARRTGRVVRIRSEEHTFEHQSLRRISYAVFCLNKTPYPSPSQLPPALHS